MDVVSVACSLGAAASAFSSAWAILDRRSGWVGTGGTSSRDRGAGDLLGGVPWLRGLEERGRARARRADALRQMPTMLDVTTLGLEAGLSFDASLELYCQRYHTLLAASLGEALLSWRIGSRSRAEALQDLADEMGVTALSRFTSAVTEALAFGTPLASALEQQAQAIRDEQRSEVEEEIEKVPVKMLIPLGTLILPAMLLAILGPLLGSALVI